MKTSTVKTAARTLDIFEAFASAKEPLSLTELARHLQSPIRSCHGLIRTLTARGYLYFLENRRRYYPTRRLLELGNALAAHDPLIERLLGRLEDLRTRTGETIIVGKRQDDAILYLLVLEGRRTIRYAASIGDRKPLHSSALGKAFLGEEDDSSLKRTLESMQRNQVTDNTITDVDRLFANIATSRKRGFFVTNGENVADVTAVARTYRIDAELLGICVAGPTSRMEMAVDNVGQALIDLQLETDSAAFV